VQYVEHVPGEHRSPRHLDAVEYNTRTYIGIEAAWGPVLVVQIGSPLGRRIVNHIQPGDRVKAGERIATARFGSRTDLFVQRDSIKPLVTNGQRLIAGMSRIAQVVPL
jgi:phosphatidylserine decarboxylase